MFTRRTSYCVLIIGVLCTLAAMAYAGRNLRTLLSGFTLWAVIPYVGLGIATHIARTPGSIIACCVVSLAAVVFGIFIYVDALFIHTGSTSALVFLFIPLYQLLAAPIVITFAIERRVRASRNI